MSTLSDNESRDVETAKQRSSHNLAHADDYASDIRTDLSEAAYETRVCNGPCKAVFRLKLTNEFSNCDHVYCDDCIDKVTAGGRIDATYCPECTLKNISEEALATCVEDPSARSGKISTGAKHTCYLLFVLLLHHLLLFMLFLDVLAPLGH
ncbi:hypothetical protein AAVH_05617 [Aphelenchoides avenae]|nr:hypothetical protein AAVH_05617 [Aphelenchus avenae]